MPKKPQLLIAKIGGKVIDDKAEMRAFLQEFAAIEGKKILVHGGGVLATAWGEKLGVQANFVDGRRITDAATLEVISAVYGGLINKNIVCLLQGMGCKAIGLTGADAGVVKSKKRTDPKRDWGYVGDVQTVDHDFLAMLLQSEIVPVLAPITYDDSSLLNTNADSLASALAVAMAKTFEVKLLYCFERAGVMRDVNEENSLASTLRASEFKNLCADGTIKAGMIPKLQTGFSAIEAGVKVVGVCKSSELKPFYLGLSAKGTWLQESL